MSIRFCWLLFFVLVSYTGYSQDIPGSVYSVFGFGDTHDRSSSFTRSLGNTSIAVRSDHSLNASNPASLTAIGSPVTSFFEIGTNYGTTYFNTLNTASKSKAGGLAGINYWFRFTKKWGSMVGVSPYSSSSYSILSSRVLGGTGATIPVHSTGTGGINQFYFGNGYDIIKNLSLGINFTYYLGSLKKSDLVPITNVSNTFEVEKQLTANGANFDLGLQYTLQIKKTKIIFGGVWDKGATLTGSQRTALVNPINFDTLSPILPRTSLRTRLPATYGGGLGVVRGRSNFAADVRFTEWKTASFDEPIKFQNTIKYSAGYEYRGDFSSFNYLKTISIRAGAWFGDYQVRVRNTPLTTWGYTVGIALPIQNNRASVALNYSVTRLGTTKNQLVQEESRKLSLDIIVRDVWGVKRKFD